MEKDPLKEFLKELRRMPVLSEEEERRLAILAVGGDEAARKRLIESNLRLVVSVARRYRQLDPVLLNLIEEGNLGLVEALRRFDPSKGLRFSTFARWFIRQAIFNRYPQLPAEG